MLEARRVKCRDLLEVPQLGSPMSVAPLLKPIFQLPDHELRNQQAAKNVVTAKASPAGKQAPAKTT